MKRKVNQSLLVFIFLFLITLSACSTSELKEITISFDSNGGSLIESIKHTDGHIITLPTAPTKTGYTFDGWYTDQNFTTTYSFNSKIPNDITVYAKWQINQYHVNYYRLEEYKPLDSLGLPSDEKIITVALGAHYTVALTSLGRVFTWGSNFSGQLGDGTFIDRIIPIEITNQFNLNTDEMITCVSVGGWHSVVLTSMGRLFTFGSNELGQLGDGTTTNRGIPMDITNRFSLGSGENILKVSTGGMSSSVITSTGRMFTWGWNVNGQLGDGTQINKNTPIDITERLDLDLNESIIHASLGERHTAVITSTGRLLMWGSNEYGQLGDQSFTSRLTPIDISLNFNLEGDEKIADVILGAIHSSAVTSTGRIFIWGNNYLGRLGDGATVNRSTPYDLSDLFNLQEDEVILGVSLGASTSSVITSLGRIFTFGQNNTGQLGDGTTSNRNTPVEVTSQFNLEVDEQIIMISLGYWHSSAITSYGRLFVWGQNIVGQLGDGSMVTKLTQIEIQKFAQLEVETYNYKALIIEFIPTREGYTFSGWYSDHDLTQQYTFSTMPAENINLFGYWIKNN